MIKIISDSSSDVFEFNEVEYASVPLKVITSDKEYIDNGSVDIKEMINDLASRKERITTSCPNAQEWLDAFNKDDDNVCVTISCNLSGSYNACLQAKEIFEEETGHKIAIVDSKCAGSELRLLIEYLAKLIKEGKSLEEIERLGYEYSDSLHTYFITSSVKNLVNAGRIPSFVGKAVSVLKMYLIGVGSDEGKIKIVSETRNYKKAVDYVLNKMNERGYTGGKVYVSSCFNEDGVNYLFSEIKAKYPNADLKVFNTGVLCTFYVENNGFIIVFEGDNKPLDI